jgi:hypothetical protein
MGEEKMIIPAYIPVGVCKECGARIYAPVGGGLPFMSACVCGGVRKVVNAPDGAKQPSRRAATGKTEDKVKAA